jgi:hypothetical protein
MIRSVTVGERTLTFVETHDGKLRIVVSGHDNEGMYGSESITLDREKCLEAFVKLCEVMPGRVK